MDLNIEGTQDRFLIDFGSPPRAAGPLKIVFSYNSGTDFTIFGLLNIKSNLSHQKARFWLRFGGHVGVEKLTSCLQEASWGRKRKKIGVPRDIKNSLYFLVNFRLPESGAGGVGAHLWG